MSINCDVLVVGAGASGSITALSLTKKGFNVVVTEKCSKVGLHTKEKIDITEETGLKEILKELKLPVKERTNKTKWFSPNYSFLLESKIHDLYFKRGSSPDCFEASVMNSALNIGADLILNARPIKINSKNEVINSVIIKENNQRKTIKPKVVIVADGFNSSMTELIGFNTIEKRITTISGYGVLGYEFNMPPSITYIFFDSKNVPGGYFFIGKAHDGECVACVVADQSMISGNLERYYNNIVNENKHIKKILNNSKVKTVFQGMSHAGLLNKRTIGNVILVGDAARTLDPLFGYGMRNSIISGYIGADIASKVIEMDDIKIIKNYESRLSDSISDIEQNARLRKIFQKLDDDDFDNIVRILSNLQNDGMDLDNLFTEKKYLLVKHILMNIRVSSKLLFKVCSSLLD